MNVQRWIARREPNWKRLDGLLRQAEGQGIKTLSATEIKDLASLYRSVSADLARARTNNSTTTAAARGYCRRPSAPPPTTPSRPPRRSAPAPAPDPDPVRTAHRAVASASAAQRIEGRARRQRFTHPWPPWRFARSNKNDASRPKRS